MAVAQDLKDLKELLDSGILTQEEFDQQKKVVLDGSNAPSPAPAAAPAPIPTINIVNTNTNTNDNSMFMRKPKSKLVALLLCIFLGYWGGHCFYCGKAGMGILYLLTFGLLGIGWLVDFIRILIGSYRDSYGMPLV
jgi:hypothetical protein